MLSSSGPGKEGAKGMRRIILIKDKVTMASFGFAFVEFVDVQVRNPLEYLSCADFIHRLRQRSWQQQCLHNYTPLVSASPIAPLRLHLHIHTHFNP